MGRKKPNPVIIIEIKVFKSNPARGRTLLSAGSSDVPQLTCFHVVSCFHTAGRENVERQVSEDKLNITGFSIYFEASCNKQPDNMSGILF